MRGSEFILRFLNILVSLALVLGLCAAGLYAGYALWDNQRVYAAAENVRDSLRSLKPAVSADEDGCPDFAGLRAVNPDVCAWLTMDNTRIDHPLVQGENNLVYMNRDVYGEFALAGSLFVDARNARDFSDAYTLVYGHRMDGHRMFGDLALYEDAAFFAANRTGTLILPDGAHPLEVIACLKVGASEEMIFEPQNLRDDGMALLRFAEENAALLHPDVLERAKGDSAARILALSTCASDYTDARTIVLTYLH